MTIRHLLSITDLSPQTLAGMVEHSAAIAGGQGGASRPLAGKIVGLYFRCSSTRTRTSFAVGAMRLGAQTIHYGPNDLQLVTGETLEDTTHVLSNFIDALVVRTNGTMTEMKALASQRGMGVINAMSENEHPTQAIADLSTIREALGRLEGVHLLYLGEGNNTAASLALAVSMTPGMKLTLVTPEGYGLPDGVLGQAHALARRNGAHVEQHHRADRLPRGVDVVYTTRWQTMGVSKAEADWLPKFMPYSVTAELMARVSKPSGTIFLHDLPAVRGHDVTDEVLDGPQSLAFRQAYHKMTGAMAVLSWCLSGEQTTVGEAETPPKAQGKSSSNV